MKKLYEWIAKHKVWAAIICAAIFALPLVIVHMLYKCYLGIPWLISDWESGDVLAYIAGFEALIGTVLLGALTLWQNERFKEENDKSQERLQKISEQQAKVLEQILLIDKSANIPLIDIKSSPDDDRSINIELFLMPDSTIYLRMFLANITEYPMKDVYVQSLVLFTYDFKYVIDKNKGQYNPHKGLPGHYDTHVEFNLSPIECKDKNEHFAHICPWHISTNTQQEDAQEWAFNNQFILEIVFEIENIYGKRILETIIYEFRREYIRSKSDAVYPSFKLHNKELRFEVVEETNNA